MSTFIRGVNLSTKWLKVVILAVMVVVCATAITLGVIFSQKQNFVVQPENNNKTDVLDNNALFSANGVDEDIATRLAQNVSLYGDNVALGNAGGSIVSSVIKLGGINWTVVYKQNDILTLYANDSVAEMSFGGNSYSQSEVRDYLLNTFYPQFLQKVGYADLDSLIVPYGDNRLYYQAKGAQAVILNTLNNGVISNNDGINGDKIWIPSAYEVGGFANTEYSPRARVNSFKTINANGFTVNSGLWNTSNEMRLNADNMWLRSNVDNSIASIANGVIKGQNSGVKLSIHPCINVYMPSVCKNEVMQASANDYSSINAVLTASGVDYSSSINSSEGTSHTGTSSDKFTISKPETLCILSSAVMSGQDFSGKYFVLTKDIDMLTASSSSDSITVWSPIGREGFPFKGNFSGNGFTISNLASAGSGLAGLFGYVDGATIEKLGILNSTWYTTNDYVGGVVCQANNSLISQCYSDSGVSGKQYVGGIVGQISASSANGVQDCYNLHAVTGSQYVGGIVGNISSSLIKNCYNTGSVGSTLGTNYGGIAGGNTSGTVTNCYYYNSTGNIIGTVISSYDAVRTASTFSGFTFRTSSNTSGTWFMSNVLNDRMPMLYIFMKNPTVNVKVVEGGTATINGDSTFTTTVGQTAPLVATPYADKTNHYYRFAGWYFYDVDLSGNMMTTDRKYSDDASISPFTVDDYYNLEARFVRIYSVTIDSVLNGFSSSYTNSSFSYTPTNATSSVAGNWYDEGTVITIELGSNNYCQLASLKESFDGTTFTNDLISKIVDTQYSFTVGDKNSDFYYISASYNRVYEIKTSVTVPSKFTGTVPTSTLSFTEAGTTTPTTITSAATSTKKTVYNSPITPTAGIVTGVEFKSYTLKVGTADSSVGVQNGLVFYISTAMSTEDLRPADSVTTLEFVATYTMTQITIKANTPSDGKVIISTTKDQQTSFTESSANALTITVDYGDAYYIYAIPSYSTGYGFSAISPTVTCATASNGVVYSTASLTATASTTYTITFALQNAYTINFAVEGISASNVELSDASVSGLNFASSVSGYTVQIKTEELAKQYFFSDVIIKIKDSDEKTFTISHTSGAIYDVITTPQSIFDKIMTTNKTVGGIYALCGITAGYSNTTIDVTLNFITIMRTITVQSFVSTDEGNNYEQDDSTLEKYYTINTNGKGGSYALNSSVTVTANTSSSANGYKVSQIKRFNADGTSEATITPTSTAYGNSATMTFTLNENKTIKIYYIMHRYQVTIADNLSELTGEQVSNSYTYKIGTANAVNYTSTFYVLYGNTLTIEANATQFNYEDTIERKAILDSIIVKTGNNEVEYSPAKSTTLLEAVTQGNYDAITIEYKFILLQALNISFTDNVTGNESSALLVILVNKNDPSNTFVMILPKGSNNTIECQATDYTISAILPIFVKANTTLGEGSSSSLNGNTLTIVGGSATSVDIKVSEIIKGSDSVYGSAIF